MKTEKIKTSTLGLAYRATGFNESFFGKVANLLDGETLAVTVDNGDTSKALRSRITTALRMRFGDLKRCGVSVALTHDGRVAISKYTRQLIVSKA